MASLHWLQIFVQRSKEFFNRPVALEYFQQKLKFSRLELIDRNSIDCVT